MTPPNQSAPANPGKRNRDNAASRMIHIFIVMTCCALLIASSGCRSTNPCVPSPSVTQFDDNPICREAYLRAYRMGYRDGLKGQFPGCHLWTYTGRMADALDAGYEDGNKAGFRMPLAESNHVRNVSNESDRATWGFFFKSLSRMDYKVATQDFLNEFKSAVTVEEVRAWAIPLLNKHQYQSSSSTISMTSKEWPQFLKKSKMPDTGFVSVIIATKNELSHINLGWGGGMGIYGLMVGSKDFEPRDTNIFYYLKWDAGIFAFHSTRD